MAEKGNSVRTDRLRLGARALPVVPHRLVSDERLLARVRGGDSGAFEALYDRHAAALLSFCFFILGSREDAEDAVQSTFAAAYRAMLRDEREIDTRPWLYAIARNACFGILRKRRPQDSEQLAQIAGEDMIAQVERRDSVRRLLAAMLELPERHRTALILAELHGHSQREIGLLLDVSPGTVKSYIFQARTALTSERSAREADCEEIRAELAAARGAALLRGPLRRHLRACAGCSEYASQISRRRRELGALLPLLPSLALRRRVLDATAGKAGGAGVLGGATAGAGAGGATFAGGIELGGVGVKALLAKALVLVAGLGASAGAGTLVLGTASSQPAVSTARVPPNAADVAWQGPRSSPASSRSVVPPATPPASTSTAAGMSQSSSLDQSGAAGLPRARQADRAGPDDRAGRAGDDSDGNGNGPGAEQGKSAEHGKSAERGSSEHRNGGEAHGVAKGHSAEHAHTAHGKLENQGKSTAHGEQSANGKALGHARAGSAADPSKGSASQLAAGSQGAAGTAAGGLAAGHGGSPSGAAEHPSNGHEEVPSSAAPLAGAHEPRGEAAHGQPAGHSPAKG